MKREKKLQQRAGKIVLAVVLALGFNSLLGGIGGPAGALASAAAIPPDQTGPIGLVSNAITCLAINSSSASSAGTIQFSWTGSAQNASLVLGVAGAQAAQPVLVNGQWVGDVPAGAPDAPCSRGQAAILNFSPSILRQGDNQIEIGDTGQPGNAWTAANVRLEVFGQVQPAATQTTGPSSPQQPAVTNQIVSFTNHYDGSTQKADIQLPDGYSTANPVPLVIYAHTRYADMTEGADVLGTAANTRHWLLATPQLHGHWPSAPNPPGAFAYASLESQYDILGTIQYLLSHGSYNVDRRHIYLVGYSMGGQVATVTAAKYPDVFAALFDVKGPTDFGEWYDDQGTLLGYNSQQVVAMRDECYTNSPNPLTPQPPSGNLFCYHRRSSVELASNLIHEPISMTHSFDDQQVPIAHSYNLRDAINSFGPDRPASVFVDTVQGPACGGSAYHHCYEPDPNAVMGFLNAFALPFNQTHLNLVTDESKAYYWLNIAQSGGNHWSYVEARANLGLRTVSLTITDNKNLTIGVNLGSAAIVDWAGLSHPGLGLPGGTYHVTGAGVDTYIPYSSGYLQFTVPATAQGVVTISPSSVTIRQLFLPVILR